MGKAILICGKICSGKSYYSEQLSRKNNAVVLSVDEIAFALFGRELGEYHDEITDRIKKYLYKKSIDIIKTGTNVILEWGFWKRSWRIEAAEFYSSRGILYEFHYIEISDEKWKMNIADRNRKVKTGEENAYYLDDGLRHKLEMLFEKPDKSEIDIWYKN
ncbi:MAG: ATP-binding protein, partial [Ruminococcus sp.]|nr:ATP-binding protein [Ruminococcus sp.]